MRQSTAKLLRKFSRAAGGAEKGAVRMLYDTLKAEWPRRSARDRRLFRARAEALLRAQPKDPAIAERVIAYDLPRA